MSSHYPGCVQQDAANVALIGWPKAFAEWMKKEGITTFGELRARFLSGRVPDRLPVSVEVLLSWRFSDAAICEHCGHSVIVYRTSMQCSVPCDRSRVIHIGARQMVHRVFPDLILRSRLD